jgi:DUF4097 and DUF4098 domain-containing protein YvlB
MRLLWAKAAFIATSMTTVSLHADETEVSFAYVPAPSAESVTIEQPLGRLSLHGWDKAEVRIVAKKHARDRAALERLRVNVEMVDGRIRIRTGVRVGQSFRALPPGPAVDGAGASAGIDLTVDAPRQVALVAKTWAGDLDASGFRAGAELASTGGEVRASDIEGKLRCNSVQGRQHLSAIHGDVEADGVTGDLELDSVEGAVLDAKVVEGQITARQVRTPVVRLFSTVGGIVFVGTLRPGGRYELGSGEGDVRLVLARVPFSVVARAPAGRVKSGFQLVGISAPTEVHGEFLGGGPSLELAAFKGDVAIEPAP